MANLYITRHGQTEWNLEGRLQGHKDSSLTETGKEHARMLKNRLEDVKIDVVYSSSSGRALQTANILAGDTHTIHPLDDLREMSFGKWEGALHKDFELEDPDLYHALFNDASAYKPADSECIESLQNRAVKAVQTIVDKHAGQNVLIVSHGITVKSILAHMEGLSFKDFWKGPFVQGCSLSVIDGSKGKVLVYADTDHIVSL